MSETKTTETAAGFTTTGVGGGGHARPVVQTATGRGADPMEAARRADTAKDVALRKAACRAVLREAAVQIANISHGVKVAGAEEVVFSDYLERSLDAYLESKENPESTRIFIGVTRGFSEITRRADELKTEEGEQ